MNFIKTTLQNILPYRTAILAVIALLLATNMGTGFFAYGMGQDMRDADYAAGSTEALRRASAANAGALAKEMSEMSSRTKAQAEIHAHIEAKHDNTYNDPAPPAFQHVYDRLRAYRLQKNGG